MAFHQLELRCSWDSMRMSLDFMGLNHQKSVLALAESIDQWKMQGGAPKIAFSW